MRSNNSAPLQEAAAKFKEGLTFCISKVGLDNSAKQEFLHTPLKQKVDLAKTKVVALMQINDGGQTVPSPSMCIKDCKLLQQSQRFDVTAIVDSLSEVRSVSDAREVVTVTLIDDSGDDGKPGQLTFAFFMDLPRSREDAATMNILQQSQENGVKEVFSFFALQGRKTDKGFSFEADSKREFFLMRAVDDRAKHLKQVAEDLQAIPQEERDILQQSSFENRNYDNEPGVQTL